MHGSLELDLAALDKLAFHRREKSGGIVEQWHAQYRRLRKHKDFDVAAKAYRWLFVPLTLWAIDVHGLVLVLIGRLSKPGRIDPRLRMLIDLIGEPPDAIVQTAAAHEEFAVQQGQYERLVKSQHKFDEIEERLAKNRRFRGEWESIKREWDVTAFANRAGVVRRRMVQERGFRSDWEFAWTNKRERFKFAFDAFCQRWDLYGMLGNQPLLMKLSVNLTPHGTMIFVPRYWSFDARRDLRWKAVSKLHRVHGAHRQGTKLIQNRRERQKEAESAKRLFATASAAGKRGAARHRFVMDGLGWHPGTDISRLQRLLKEASGNALILRAVG
jgi:hypothetical protein